MGEIKGRLTAYLNLKGINKSEFGRVIGVSNSYVSSMRKSIQPEKVDKIAECYPDLNIEWLMTGEGEMLKGQSITQHVGDGNSNFSNTGNVTDGVPLVVHEKALNEISELRKLVSKGQEQIDRLISIIEKQ